MKQMKAMKRKGNLFKDFGLFCQFFGYFLVNNDGLKVGNNIVPYNEADLLPDTDFNLQLPMRAEICLMINFNL